MVLVGKSKNINVVKPGRFWNVLFLRLLGPGARASFPSPISIALPCGSANLLTVGGRNPPQTTTALALNVLGR